MSGRLHELQMRRRSLLLRSEQLRSDLATDQRLMLDALGGVDRAISTARRFARPALMAVAGAVLLRMFRRSRPARGASLAMRALFWVSTVKRALPFIHLARSLWRSRMAARRSARASAAPDEPF